MKRDDIKRRPMADSVLKALEPDTIQYREKHDGDLHFQVKPSGAKSWVLRYKKLDGKWSWMGLGPYPKVSAAKARELAAEQQKIAAQGIDLVENKKNITASTTEKNSNTFAAIAKRWYDHNAAGWSPATAEKCDYYLKKDILPVFGHKPISAITPEDTANLMETIEKRGAMNVAQKTRQWLYRIFSFAQGKGLIRFNPASDLNEIAAKAPAPQHHPHLLEHELADFLKALSAYGGFITTKTAARLVVLSACRPGVVRAAEWTEFDLEKGIWEIPAEKMKMRRTHVVPLQTQMISLLKELKSLTGNNRYLFPSQGGYGERNVDFISEGSINKAFARMGYKSRMTGHGSRHTASTLLNEHDWTQKYVDAQLSHKSTDKDAPKMRAEYNHARFLPQRTKMMQWYSDYLYALEHNTKKPEMPALNNLI